MKETPQEDGLCSLPSEEDIHAITEQARLSYRRSQRGIKGQTMTQSDGIEYHVIVATINHLSAAQK